MTWLSHSEAAAALKVSSRTLTARISKNVYQVRREGRKCFVDVPNADSASVADVASVSGKLAAVVASNALDGHHNAEAISAMVRQHSDHLADMRDSIDATETRLRGSQRANIAATAAMVMMVSVCVWLGTEWRSSMLTSGVVSENLMFALDAQWLESERLEAVVQQREGALRAASLDLAEAGQARSRLEGKVEALEHQRDGLLEQLKARTFVKWVTNTLDAWQKHDDGGRGKHSRHGTVLSAK